MNNSATSNIATTVIGGTHSMRQIVLDTETTGLNYRTGDRIVEIGCVELIDRSRIGKHFHCYLNPDRKVELGAWAIHGLRNDFLADKPRFADVASEFLAFISGCELIIHNAPFDIGFLNAELELAGYGSISAYCPNVFDTLQFARALRKRQKNNLNALCSTYGIDTSQRQAHGALLDARILAEVYVAMMSPFIHRDGVSSVEDQTT